MPIKVGDIVEIDIEMEIMASPEELESKKELDTNEYKRKYRVEYSINDMKFQLESVLEAEPNMVPPEDNIRTNSLKLPDMKSLILMRIIYTRVQQSKLRQSKTNPTIDFEHRLKVFYKYLSTLRVQEF